MGCCNELSVPLTPSGPQNPALHVNYTKGMVLGVDDFTQEFTYLSARDQWAIRELAGYGTTSGLRVSLDDTDKGPRIRVSPGAAAVPSGKLVCVPAEQCGLINQWLAKPGNAARIDSQLVIGSPPPGDGTAGTVSLYLTLCYHSCTTQPVPIPGEPCRSEDQLMADSRVADDFRLELRTEAPAQTEEDAIRDFVAWLKQVAVVDFSPPPAADETAWLEDLRAAAKPWFDAMNASPPITSPPTSLNDFMYGSPPAGLLVAREDLAAFLRVAFRFWVTEVRPMWMAGLCGTAARANDDCLLLARLDVPIVWVGGSPSGAWLVQSGQASDIVTIDQSRRSCLADLRLLQEWLLAGLSADTLTTTGDQTSSGAVHIAMTTVASDLTLNASHHCVVCNAGITLTLPRCAIDNRGRAYIVKNVGANATITCDPLDSIDGSGTSAVLTTGRAVTLVSDGTNTWHVISALA